MVFSITSLDLLYLCLWDKKRPEVEATKTAPGSFPKYTALSVASNCPNFAQFADSTLLCYLDLFSVWYLLSVIFLWIYNNIYNRFLNTVA